MAMPHTGAWGTWDFGITEGIGNILGAERTNQGGSELSPWLGSSNASNPQSKGAELARDLGAVKNDIDISKIYTDDRKGSNTDQGGGDTGGNNGGGNNGGGNGDKGGNSGGSGGGDSRLKQLEKTDRNPKQEEEYQNLLKEQMFSQINELYNPALKLYSDLENTVRGQAASARGDISARYDKNLSDYELERQKLLDQTAVGQQGFNRTIQSALDEAARTYSGMSQKAQALYGGQGIGQLMQALAGRELVRTQGKASDRQAEGDQQFSTERKNIGEFVTSKIGDLKLWKDESLNQLEANLQNRLFEIGNKKYEIEANRTRDKMNVIQGIMQQAQQIELMDREFRTNLGLAAVNRLQELSGRAFTPAEIKAYISEFTSDFSFGGDGGSTVGNDLTAAARLKNSSGYQDEFSELTGNTNQQNTGNQNQGTQNTTPALAQSLMALNGLGGYPSGYIG